MESGSRSLVPCSGPLTTGAADIRTAGASDHDLGKGYDEDDVNVFFNKILFGNTEDPHLLQFGKGLKRACEENDLLQVIRKTLHLAVLYHFDKIKESKVKGMEKRKRRQRKKRRIDDNNSTNGDEDMIERKTNEDFDESESADLVQVSESISASADNENATSSVAEQVIVPPGIGDNDNGFDMDLQSEGSKGPLVCSQPSTTGSSTDSEDAESLSQGIGTASRNDAENNSNGRLLWEFLLALLNDPVQRYAPYITWLNKETGVFRIVNPPELARLWGIQKNHLSMNYDKLSRALRYYYRVNILKKVQGQKHCYQFLKTSKELKGLKNFPLVQQASPPPIPVPGQNSRVSLVTVSEGPSPSFGGYERSLFGATATPQFAPLSLTTKKPFSTGTSDQAQGREQPLQLTVKMEPPNYFDPYEYEEGPTDLSMVVIR